MIIKIWQNSNVNVNEQPVKVLLNPNVQVGVLKSSYPPATLPLSDTDKFLVRQGSNWKEVDKSEFGGGEKQQYIYDFGGYWILKKDKYTYPSKYTYGVRASFHEYSNAANDVELLSRVNVSGWVIQENGLKIARMDGKLLYGYSAPVRFIIAKKRYITDTEFESEVVWDKNITLDHYKRWNYEINSDVEFNIGDEIIFFIQYLGDSDTVSLYSFLTQIKMK